MPTPPGVGNNHLSASPHANNAPPYNAGIVTMIPLSHPVSMATRILRSLPNGRLLSRRAFSSTAASKADVTHAVTNSYQHPSIYILDSDTNSNLTHHC